MTMAAVNPERLPSMALKLRECAGYLLAIFELVAIIIVAFVIVVIGDIRQ